MTHLNVPKNLKLIINSVYLFKSGTANQNKISAMRKIDKLTSGKIISIFLLVVVTINQVSTLQLSVFKIMLINQH